MQGVFPRECVLRLFVEGEEKEVQKSTECQTWTPDQRPYVLCFPTTYTY